MKVVHVATNFTAGEMSPRTRARVDVAQYNAGARQLRNAFPRITGGAVSRPGTTYTAAAKYADKKARLVPFVTKRGATYVVEFGDLYMRFFKDGAAVGGPLEVAHPFTEAQLFDLDYTQDSDTMYMAHEAVPTHRLRRFSDTLWSAESAPFTAQPFDEIGLRPPSIVTLSLSTVGAGRTATASGASFLASDVGRAITFRSGVFVVTGFTSTTVVTGDITIAFDTVTLPASQWTLDASPQTACTPSVATPVGTSITLTLAADGWRSEDVGKHVVINGGLCRITAYTSALVVNAVILTELSGITAAPALAWQLKSSQWNALDGYPRSVTIHQQRLIAAGSPGFPQTIWGSRVGEPLDFTIGTSDAEGYAFEIGSDENNQIAFVASGRHLMALTYGAEYSLRGQATKSVISTASPPEVVPEANNGCANVRPVQVRRENLFVQRAGKEVRALGYRYDFDAYDAPDLSALADHLFDKLEDGSSISIVDMAYQQRPNQLLWCVRSDGLLAALTVDRTQNVVGWSLHDVGGFVESVCSVPSTDGDVLYLLVKRTINGVVGRYIERMEMTTSSTKTSERYLMQLDFGKFIYNAGGQSTAQHPQLPLTEVDVLIDGAYGGRFTTDATGTVTLPRTAFSIQIGLPFVATVEPNTPEDVGSIGQKQSSSRIILRLFETGDARVNGHMVATRHFGPTVLDAPPPLLTEDVPLSELGWYDGADPVVITRELPFPLHVLAVVRDLTVNA